MNDTRPLAAILSNQRGKHGWLENALTVDDVHGQAQITVTRERIVISHALAESDDIDVGAKGIIDARTRKGVFYVRFKKWTESLKPKMATAISIFSMQERSLRSIQLIMKNKVNSNEGFSHMR